MNTRRLVTLFRVKRGGALGREICDLGFPVISAVIAVFRVIINLAIAETEENDIEARLS